MWAVNNTEALHKEHRKQHQHSLFLQLWYISRVKYPYTEKKNSVQLNMHTHKENVRTDSYSKHVRSQ